MMTMRQGFMVVFGGLAVSSAALLGAGGRRTLVPRYAAMRGFIPGGGVMQRAMKPLVGILAGGIVLLALLIAPAYAIVITGATFSNGTVTVSGSHAVKSVHITWEASVVTTSNPGGAFTFTTADVPSDCVGTLSDGVSTIAVAISGCPRRLVIDQLQPVIDITVGGLTINAGQWLAQSVTVGLGGTLVGVFLPVACDTGSLVIGIRALDVNNNPGDTVLASVNVDAVNLSSISPPVFRLIETGAGLPFAQGDRFAIVLQNPTGDCGIFQGPLGESYVGGEGFFQDPAFPGWIRFSEFETRDLPFMTLMQLP